MVLSDITSRKLMEKQITDISDREQRRIGQDLHDSLCQHLVSVAFAGELLRENLARQTVPEATQAEAIVEMVNEAISEARNLARGLYPVRLEVDGLASALEELAASVQARDGHHLPLLLRRGSAASLTRRPGAIYTASRRRR